MDGLKRNGGMDELKKDGGLDELKKDGGMGELKKDGGIDAVKRDGGMDEEKAAAVMKKALDVAMETRDEFWKEWSKRYKESDRGFPSVVVSVGPQAVFMHDCSEYGGKAVDALSGEQLKQWHRKQLTVFANFTKQQPIIVSFETMSAVREVIAVVQLMQQAFPMLSAWISLTCKNEEVTWHDDKIEDVVNAILLEINNNNNNNINNNNNNNNNNTNNNNKNDKNNSKSNIVGVGINCTKPMYVECLLKKVCRCLHQAGMMDSIGVVLYPNPHNEWIDGEKRWQRLDSSTEWSGHFRKWIQVYKNFRNKNKNDNDNENQKNINDKDNNNKKNNDNIGDELRGGLLLGGCCLVTPEDIRTLKEVVDEALKI